MCGRFTLVEPEVAIEDLAPTKRSVVATAPRYNIAPTQDVVAVAVLGGDRTATEFRWGLIPPWAKELAMGSRMINARSETVAEKPSFRTPFRRRRCLVLADGYYEWQKTDAGKQPTYIRPRGGAPFAFAALYDVWHAGQSDEVTSTTIITASAPPELEAIHHRVPVVMAEADYDAWLDPEFSAADPLLAMLRRPPAPTLDFYPVSTRVNSPRNDDATCIAPVAG